LKIAFVVVEPKTTHKGVRQIAHDVLFSDRNLGFGNAERAREDDTIHLEGG
jgi:hypothetical protein